MAYYINNQATTDKYTGPGAITLGPFFDADTCTVLVSGAPAALQFFVGDESNGRWIDERDYIAPAGSGTTNSFKVGNVRGVRAKSANAGISATIAITLFRTGARYDTSDPLFEAGSLSPGTITTSGTVNPGQASVEVDHNGAKIGIESIVDFEDGTGLGLNFQVTDDPTNLRTKISALLSLEGAKRFMSAAQAIGNNVLTTLSWDASSYDTDGIGGNGGMVIKVAGKYRASFALSFINNVTGTRECFVTNSRGPTQLMRTSKSAVVSGAPTTLEGSVTFDAQVGDFISMSGFQDSGGTLGFNTGVGETWFSIERIG